MYKALFIVLLLSVAIFGCSDEAKEGAADLEQQMQGESQNTEAVESEAMEPVDTAMEVTAGPEDMVSAEPERTMPPRPTGGFAVQVASCEEEGYAGYLVDLYAKRGYEAYISTVTYNDQTYYRVRIGGFTSLGEAQTLQAELKDMYSVNGWIDRVEQ